MAPPQPSANAGCLGQLQCRHPAEVIYGAVSLGSEMEWKENITAEISLVVQIRHPQKASFIF